jgi:hypothetical protein
MSQPREHLAGLEPDADGWIGPTMIRENIRTGQTSALYIRGDEEEWRPSSGKIMKLKHHESAPS